MMDALLSLDEAATFFGCHPDTVRLWAADGTIRGAKVGRAWRFKQADLERHFEALCGGACQSTKGTGSGGSICGTSADVLDELLERRTEELRRGNTTNLRLVSGKKKKPDARSKTRSRHGSKIGSGEQAT